MRGSRSPRLVLAVLALTAFTLTTLDFRAGSGSPFDAVRTGADTVLGPAQRSLGSATRAMGGALGGALPGNASAELDRLREENAQLRGQLVAGEAAARRLSEWEALLRLKDFGTYPMVPAHVSAVGSSLGFERTVTLDVGSSDGVQVGQTVVSGAGLVGRTVRVGPWTSVVLLLVDPGFSVGARLTREGTVGLASGTGDGSVAYAQVEGGRVAVGDALLTTGSQTFVPGVPIGRVEEVDRAVGALTRAARVRPFVDITSLDLVGVVVEPPRGTPRVPLAPSPPP